MGFFSGIGKIVKKVVRVAKKIVKGAVGTVKGALKGDPMAMASLAMMVYGGYQAGQFLFNKAALTGLKTGALGQTLGQTGAQITAGLGGTKASVFPAFGGTYGTAAATGASTVAGAGAIGTPLTSSIMSSTQLARTSVTAGGALRTIPTSLGKDWAAKKSVYQVPQKAGLKSFFDPKGLAKSGVKSYAQMRGATGYSQQQAALEKQESYYENYMNMSQQMFERFGGGYAPFSASSTPKYAMSFNQKRNSIPPSFKPYFQYAAGTSNFGAATNIIDAALNRSYITQYA